MRGECLNLLMTISGNRYGRGLVRPGGVAVRHPAGHGSGGCAAGWTRLRAELEPAARSAARERLGASADSKASASSAGRSAWSSASSGSSRAGLRRAARRPARSSVRRLPVRPHPGRDGLGRRRAGACAGAAGWRSSGRSSSCSSSCARCRPARSGSRAGRCEPDELAVAMEEGWRGEIVHVAITDPAGELRRYKVTDPSFHNWTALALGDAGQPDLRLPALQQELQPVVRGARPLSAERRTERHARLLRTATDSRGPGHPRFPKEAPEFPERFRGRPALRRGPLRRRLSRVRPIRCRPPHSARPGPRPWTWARASSARGGDACPDGACQLHAGLPAGQLDPAGLCRVDRRSGAGSRAGRAGAAASSAGRSGCGRSPPEAATAARRSWWR